MSISILDCTLRDGGYVNNFNFGEKTITSIIRNLDEAGIDIIECGFLISGKNDRNYSLFSSPEKIIPYIGNKNENTMYVKRCNDFKQVYTGEVSLGFGACYGWFLHSGTAYKNSFEQSF